MAKDALPARFVVDRRGTPDPDDSEYFVLDVVYDRSAREVLWMLARRYRNNDMQIRAEELEALLTETDRTVRQKIEASNQQVNKKVGRPRSARPRR